MRTHEQDWSATAVLTWVGTAVLLWLLAAAGAFGQTTTTRTDQLIASTKAIVGGSTLGAQTLNVTGTLGVSGTATVDGDINANANILLDGGNYIYTGAGSLIVQGFTNLFLRSSGTSTIAIGDTTASPITLGVGGGNTTVGADLAVNGGDITSPVSLSITPAAGQTLVLNPGSNLFLGPGSGSVMPGTNYAVDLGTLSTKFRTIHAAELWVETLVAQDTIATIGGRVLVMPTTVLTVDLAAAGTTITVKHNQIASGDRLYLEANGKVEFMAVTSGAGGSAGAYTYSVTRNLDGSGANDWYQGDAVANTGTTGDGWIDLYSVRGMKAGTEYGPTIVGNERLSATYNDWEARWAIGNLNGLYGYSADTYGVALGDPSASNVVIDATNGIRFRNSTTVLGSWVGSTVTLGQPLTSNNTGQLVIDSDSVDLKWRNNTGTTSTVLTLANDGGSGLITVAGDIYTTGVFRGATLRTSSGSVTIDSTDTGGNVIFSPGVGGSIRAEANNTYPLGNSSYVFSAVYATTYYGGTTAGVSGTCSAVTVTGGIVTGCTP